MEAIGDITATCDVSRLQVDGNLFDSRIQGGVLADGISGIIAGLCTITPMSVFGESSFPHRHHIKASSLRL
jgi:xanthine/uracil permease